MFAGEFATNLQSKALTCEFIDYNKHLQGTTIDCTIKNEVDRPDVIPGFRFPANNPTISRTQSTPFDSLFRNLKALWSAPLKRMRVLYEGSHKEIIDDQKAKTTKA